LALLGYSFQIYFDFSGYSDIAIGSSRFFGIRIMENFNNPYLAPNLSQFWRRWHISLSDWIRDYLFFPLSKLSSTKLWQIFFVPVIAMALCGLWHGPSWNYVIWGVWHGMGLSVLQLWNSYKRNHKRLAKATKANWFSYAGVFMTFSFVTLGWWWFR
jgi:alginate O-acetyltransferase complex protein AlgI